MGILSRRIFREIVASALLGTVLFTFVLFLERMRYIFAMLVRSQAGWHQLVNLFLLILPPALTFTIPVGVLVGVLLTMTRMSGDAEITAMRAAGLTSRRVLPAVLTIASVAMLLTAMASLWLTPYAVRQRYKLMNQLAAAQLTAEIQPRVFEEKFPNTVLYVGDVVPGKVVRWKNLFMADITPADQRKEQAHEQAGDAPKITVASEAIAVPDSARNRIQLLLQNGSTHFSGKLPEDYYSSRFPLMNQMLQADRPAEIRPRVEFIEMDTLPLWKAIHTETGRDRIDALIELHQRLALPPACVLLALIAVPLGVSSRKGGKSSAFVLTVLIAFLYYMALISLISLAREGRVPAAPAVWFPNLVLAILSAIALWRIEKPGDRDLVGDVRTYLQSLYYRVRGRFSERADARPVSGRRWAVLPQLIDTYVLSRFLYFFVLMLVSFVLMTHVFTFFDLLGDIVKNRIPIALVAKYLFFLTPQLVYVITPISVLVAVLVTFGVLSKNNEVTALKACGVSLYRLSVPVLLASLSFSGLLYAFDYTYIPQANLIQDSIRAQIKGKPPQTYLRPDRKWIFGRGSRIYFYKYFSPAQDTMAGVTVYDLDPATFRLKRIISAGSARWEPKLNSWVFQSGWARFMENDREFKYLPFQSATQTFSDLDEAPSWFLKEVKQDKQMNAPELAHYIDELRQSGFDTVALQVQLQKKFAVPLFALIMAMIAVPFAFLVGTRGAITGVGVSLGIAVAYWTINQIFEQIGNVNQLPPEIAAWAPDAVFGLCGLYLLAHMKT